MAALAPGATTVSLTEAQRLKQAAERAVTWGNTHITAQPLAYQLLFQVILGKMQCPALGPAFPLSIPGQDPKCTRTCDGAATSFVGFAGIETVLPQFPMFVQESLIAAGLPPTLPLTPLLDIEVRSTGENPYGAEYGFAEGKPDVFVREFAKQMGNFLINILYTHYLKDNGELKDDLNAAMQEWDKATNGDEFSRTPSIPWQVLLVGWVFAAITEIRWQPVEMRSLLSCTANFLNRVTTSATKNLARDEFTTAFEGLLYREDFGLQLMTALGCREYDIYKMGPFSKAFAEIQGKITNYHAILFSALARVYMGLSYSPPLTVKQGCADFLMAVTDKLQHKFAQQPFFITSQVDALAFSKICFDLGSAYELITLGLSPEEIKSGLNKFQVALSGLGFSRREVEKYSESWLGAILYKKRSAGVLLNPADFSVLTEIENLSRLVEAVNNSPFWFILRLQDPTAFQSSFGSGSRARLVAGGAIAFHHPDEIISLVLVLFKSQGLELKTAPRVEVSTGSRGETVWNLSLVGVQLESAKSMGFFFPSDTSLTFSVKRDPSVGWCIVGLSINAKPGYIEMLNDILQKEKSTVDGDIQKYFALSLIRKYFDQKMGLAAGDVGKIEALLVEIILKCLVGGTLPEGGAGVASKSVYQTLMDLGRPTAMRFVAWGQPDILTKLLQGEETASAFTSSLKACQEILRSGTTDAESSASDEGRGAGAAHSSEVVLRGYTRKPPIKAFERTLLLSYLQDLVTYIEEKISPHSGGKAGVSKGIITQIKTYISQLQAMEDVDLDVSTLPTFRRRSGSVVSKGSNAEGDGTTAVASRRGSGVSASSSVSGADVLARIRSEGIGAAFGGGTGGGGGSAARAVSASATDRLPMPSLGEAGAASPEVFSPGTVRDDLTAFLGRDAAPTVTTVPAGETDFTDSDSDDSDAAPQGAVARPPAAAAGVSLVLSPGSAAAGSLRSPFRGRPLIGVGSGEPFFALSATHRGSTDRQTHTSGTDAPPPGFISPVGFGSGFLSPPGSVRARVAALDAKAAGTTPIATAAMAAVPATTARTPGGGATVAGEIGKPASAADDAAPK